MTTQHFDASRGEIKGVPAEFHEVATICAATDVMIGGREVLGLEDARDLHAGLVVGKDYTNWIKARIAKYGFSHGLDFEVSQSPKLATGNFGSPEPGNQTFDSPERANQTGRGGDRRSVSYTITLNMAKELAMVENNPRGRLIRRYYIWLEEHGVRRAAELATAPVADAAPFDGFDRNDVRTALLMVSECRTTWGRAQARAPWRRLPLPQVADLVPGADVLGEFVATMIVSAPGAKLQSKVLYAGYLSWCRLNSRPPVNTTVFGMELARRGFAKHKSGVLYYDDIALTSGAAHAPR